MVVPSQFYNSQSWPLRKLVGSGTGSCESATYSWYLSLGKAPEMHIVSLRLQSGLPKNTSSLEGRVFAQCLTAFLCGFASAPKHQACQSIEQAKSTEESKTEREREREKRERERDIAREDREEGHREIVRYRERETK